MTKCTVSGGELIAKGDTVCVIGFDTAENCPIVKRATRENLATSKTIFGVATDDADGGGVFVLVAGEVAGNAVTRLGAGSSRIIATDINNATAPNQCKLIRIDRPDGSEFVVGTCDEDGNLAVQPRASRDTSNLQVFNVKSYGALGDGATDDSTAITNAISAVVTGRGTLFFPSGTYSVASNLTIPAHIQVTFEEGAMLAPSGAAVTIEGPVTCHPAQQVFGGTGFNSPVAGGPPTITVSGSAFGNYSVVVQIENDAAHFRYTLNGGFPSFPPLPIAPSVVIPSTGLTVGFGPGPYEPLSTYSWTSLAPITLGPASFDHFNVRNFGAIPDYVAGAGGTDNLPFFQAALAAMAASGKRSAQLVVDGHFYLSDTLVLTQTVALEGTGQNEPPPFHTSRSSPGTMLVFPKNVTGIRIHSADLEDNPTGSGEKSIIRNLTLYCEERDKIGDGIHASVTCFIEHVNIQNFAKDGIHIIGHEVSNLEGNSNGFGLKNCWVGGCGRDGFHIAGADATGGSILGCVAVVNMRYGFFDAARMNAYVGCLAEGNGAEGVPGLVTLGAEYHTEGDNNSSTFVGCYAEGRKNDAGTCEFYGQVNCIGGTLGNSTVRQDSSAFLLEHGVATRAPFVYKNLAGAKSIGCSLGDMSQTVQKPGTEMIAFQWATLKSAESQEIDDFTSLRYLDKPDVPPETRGHGWWALAHNNSFYRHIIRLPTTCANARLPAPWFVNGIFLGRDDIGPPKVSFTAAPKLPNTQDGGEPLTYERGDVVWNSEPSPGGPIGQVCIDSGTLSVPLGVQTADPVDATDTTVKLSRVDLLKPGQCITIGDGADVYTITEVKPVDSTIIITPGVLIGVSVGAAVEFTIPTAAPVNVGDVQVPLKNVEGLVPGQYIKIGNGTDAYKIVKVTLATIDITPEARIGVSVGAAIAIAGGAPIGAQTSKTVSKGDTTVSLNNGEGLVPGQDVTIGGGTDVYTIVKVTLPAIDIAPPGALVGVPAGVAIAFRPATFSTFGAVENIGNSASYAVDKLLELRDRYVTVTATGITITLPRSPVDGQTHSIKAQADVTALVDTRDGALIDGALPATVGPLENRNFRYSVATAQWEIR